MKSHRWYMSLKRDAGGVCIGDRWWCIVNWYNCRSLCHRKLIESCSGKMVPVSFAPDYSQDQSNINISTSGQDTATQCCSVLRRPSATLLVTSYYTFTYYCYILTVLFSYCSFYYHYLFTVYSLSISRTSFFNSFTVIFDSNLQLQCLI